jgi:hypothetical protein
MWSRLGGTASMLRARTILNENALEPPHAAEALVMDARNLAARKLKRLTVQGVNQVTSW